MWKFSDLWPSRTNRESILGELISATLVGKHSQGISSVVIPGATVGCEVFSQRRYTCGRDANGDCSVFPVGALF